MSGTSYESGDTVIGTLTMLLCVLIFFTALYGAYRMTFVLSGERYPGIHRSTGGANG